MTEQGVMSQAACRVRRHLRRYLPLRDLAGYGLGAFRHDLSAAAVVSFLSVPQGVAYALIAGLPPAMGLYATAVPAIIGSLFRSSRHVITGPTNAMSLLIGSILARETGLDPIKAATTLAVLTGLLQFSAGFLRLGVIVDYISSPVVLGYITGAGVLIGVGQLKNATGSPGVSGNLATQLDAWLEGLAATDLLTVALSVGTILLIVGLRRLNRRVPSAMIAMVGGILLSWIFDLPEHGVRTIGDLGSVPLGLPPLTMPDFGAMPGMVSIAVAAMVLSFVESSSVARAIAIRTGQRLDMSAEFAGQGLANIAGGLTGAFVTSGSLLRSAINESSGARSRLAGAMSGAFMLAVLLVLGPIIDYTPIACLAGLLIVVAAELIDWSRIRSTFRSTKSDAAAFVVTLGGTWTLPLDHAIELGVVISIILFLRRARLLVIGELVLDEDGALREVEVHADSSLRCPVVRILNVEGPLFFGAAGELQGAFDATIADQRLKVLVVRLKRTQSMDSTTAAVIASVAARLAREERHLVLAGLRPEHVALLERTGVARLLGHDHLFPTRKTWFAAMHDALDHAVAYAEEHDGPQVARLRRRLGRARSAALGGTPAASYGPSPEEVES